MRSAGDRLAPSFRVPVNEEARKANISGAGTWEDLDNKAMIRKGECYEQGIHNRGSCRQAKRHYFRILGIRKSGCYIYEVSGRALLLGGRVNSNTQYRYVAARSYQRVEGGILFRESDHIEGMGIVMRTSWRRGEGLFFFVFQLA